MFRINNEIIYQLLELSWCIYMSIANRFLVLILLLHLVMPITSLGFELNCDSSDNVRVTVIREDMLKLLILTYNDMKRFLEEMAKKDKDAGAKLGGFELKMHNIDNYSVDICEKDQYFIVKFDPKKIRQSEGMFGGSL
jgi:hypothetical protein